MRRPGCDEDNLTAEDFLCDFCARTWAEDRPMVEGHHGSCICGPCLSVAYTALVLQSPEAGDPGLAPPGTKCALCLEQRDEPAWPSPVRDAAACRRCVKQSAAVLQKDKSNSWKKPEA